MKRIIKIFFLFFILILNSGFYGLNQFQKNRQSVTPFKVIRTLTDGSQPSFNNKTSSYGYYGVNNSADLILTDGTPAGTQKMGDLLPNLPGSTSLMGESQGLVYYYSFETSQVYRSDNTNAGTFAISAANVIASAGNVITITFSGSTYTFFPCSDSNYDPFYCFTDGTFAGTSMVAAATNGYIPSEGWQMTSAGITLLSTNFASGDIELYNLNPATKTFTGPFETISNRLYYGFLSEKPPDGSKFYFSLHIWGGCDQIYVTDGTQAGTYQLSATQYCIMKYVGQANDGSQLFLFTPGFNNWQLYKSKGTSAADWTLVKDFGPMTSSGWSVDFSYMINGRLVLRFTKDNDGANPASCPIWVSDGTTLGTTLLTNGLAIHAGTDANQNTSMLKPFVFQNKIYFQGYTLLDGEGIWTTDGTAPPVAVAKNLSFNAVDNSGWPAPTQAAVTPNYFVFAAQTNSEGNELYASDGTLAGTVFLKDIFPGATDGVNRLTTEFGVAIGNKVVFPADNGVNGLELWVTDGTPAGTNILKLLNQNPGAPMISRLEAVGSNFYFTARDNSHGQEPWVSDGTTAGTQLLKDSEPGVNSGIASNDGNFVNTANGAAFRTTKYSDNSARLWLTDGSPAGTTNYYSGEIYSPLVQSNSKVFFVGHDAINNNQLWTTDGTVGNTALVKVLGTTSTFSNYATWLVPFSNSVAFQPSYNTAGGLPGNLWISDGTSGGTSELYVYSNTVTTNYGIYSNQVVNNNKLFYLAGNASYHYSLYVTDGTPGGSSLVKDVNPGGEPNYTFLGQINGKFLFTADDGTNGIELWVSDGTGAGTTMLYEFSPGAASTYIYHTLTVSDGTNFYFITMPDGQDASLWKTDGTPGGTLLVHNFSATEFPDGSAKMIVAGNYLFFSVCSNSKGCELWRSDKTSAGTKIFWDLVPGPEGSDPGSLLYFSNRIYFVGNYLKSSRAIWSTGLENH